jgi:hypothetical protein
MNTMMPDQDEIDAMLFSLTLECARPSWRFRFLFGARERQLLGFAINSFMGQRQQNLLMNRLDQRYGNHGQNSGPQEAQQAGVPRDPRFART